MSSTSGKRFATAAWLAICLLSQPAPRRALAQAAPAAEALDADLARAAAKGQWERATALAREIASQRPESPEAAFNLACVLARAGSGAEAVATLKRSADLGFAFTSTLLRDEDLDSIRKLVGYEAAVAKVRANNAARLELVKPRLDATPLLTSLPDSPASPPPLILALHGYGGTPEQMIEVYREPAARLGAILVAPRGQQAVGAGFGWGVVEEAEYLVLKAIDRVAAERSFGPVVITGFSQGGGMTYTLALRHPERFAGAVPVAGFYEERLAPIPAGANLPRFFLMNGEFDPEVENTRATQRIFKKSDLRSELRIYPAVGHAYPLARERSRELELALRFVLSTAGAAD